MFLSFNKKIEYIIVSYFIALYIYIKNFITLLFYSRNNKSYKNIKK